MTTIAIAEDHQSLIDGISLLLEYEAEYKIVGTANNGEELLDIVRKMKPDIVLTDIKMPKIDGIAATRIIKSEFPETCVIGFSMFDQTNIIQEMLDAGACGYLLKNSPLEEVLNAINLCNDGERYFDKNIDISFLNDESTREVSANKSLFTKSEKAILGFIGQGKTSSEIADLRFTSVSTVEKHRKNMIQKLGLQGKGELLRYALDKKYKY